MPYLNIQTNVAVSDTQQEKLLRECSRLVSSELGKPEEYMMVACKAETPMLFAGNASPTAFLEIKSIGIPTDKTKPLCKQLCLVVEELLNIDPARVYVKFNDVQRTMWGWKGDTFG